MNSVSGPKKSSRLIAARSASVTQEGPPQNLLFQLSMMSSELGGVFSRNGSGALSLAHVADQRYSGYIEHHMNTWDCLAGQLIVKEAGGLIENQNAQEMIALGAE